MTYDIVIIGSGPAGLTASIYASRANKNVLVIEKESFGGMITHSPKVENYPGVGTISGLDLADKFVNQAMDLGVNFEFDHVVQIDKVNDYFLIKGEQREYKALSVIIATGSKHRTLKLEHEERLVGKGISYCAVCDGPFYMGQDVTIIGGGNSAMQEALMLSSYCKSVTMIQNMPYFTGEKALAEQISKTDNISVMFNKVVVGLLADDKLNSLVLLDQTTNQKEVYETNSIFVAIGQEANNDAFKNVCDLDNNGFIVSDEMCNTKTSGIFVAGDCKEKRIRQVVTATSDGSIAALQAIRYLDSK